MAKRHSKQPIPPFPPEIDRRRFGDWLSGFTDGEGTFILGYTKHKNTTRVFPQARFCIVLRSDDVEILRQIQSFWQCGDLYARKKVAPSCGPNANLTTQFYVASVPILFKTVVPHFDNHPLRAKKAKDFAIWKAAVALLYKVRTRRRLTLGGGGGTLPKWTRDELLTFDSLLHAIKKQREFRSPQSE